MADMITTKGSTGNLRVSRGMKRRDAIVGVCGDVPNDLALGHLHVKVDDVRLVQVLVAAGSPALGVKLLDGLGGSRVPS